MNHPHGGALELFVKRLESRSVLTEEEVSALLGLNGQIKQVAAHFDLVPLGEGVEHCSLVIEGLVGRFEQTRDGVRQITSFHIPGDMADLPSVVSSKAGWALGALTRTTILCVPHTNLRRLTIKHPGVAEAFWRDCVADGSMSSAWVVNVGRRNALSRTAHLFCEMAIRYEHAGQGDRRSFPLPITQAVLGEATGLTTVHINRVLRELRIRSIVELRGAIVTIHDWEKLVSVSNFDPAFLLLDGPSLRINEAV